MSNAMLNKEWAAIDIGTTKICALIAKLDAKGDIEIIGIGHNPSHGLKKGVVVDINSTVKSIQKAIAVAEEMAGSKIEQASIGISGGHIQSFNSQGVVVVHSKEVSQEDIDKVIDIAKAIPIPEDREILHILPQYFKVDGQEQIKDSLGMQGIRLESQIHIITGSISSVSNIIKCCEDAGVGVSDIVLETLASAESVLTEAERELGVGVIDIGGGTSDFAIYKDGRILHSKVLPIAGNHFTRDLAIGLQISLKEAEELKRKYGFVSSKNPFSAECTPVGDDLGWGSDGRAIDPYSLYEILHPRAREVFELIVDDIVEFNLRPFMPYGLVLTGGGSLLARSSVCLCVLVSRKTISIPKEKSLSRICLRARYILRVTGF